MSYTDLLEAEFRAFGIRVPERHCALLETYCRELERWNRKINLTSLSGRELVRRLVVQPAWIGLELGMSGLLADIGSGNGSPAIPLHIIAGMERSHLVETRGKRATFLRHLASTLQLPGVVVHRGRFDQVREGIERVNWVTLQGMTCDAQLIESIRKIAIPTTTIVWITSGARPPVEPFRWLKLPITSTEVLLFKPDHS